MVDFPAPVAPHVAATAIKVALTNDKQLFIEFADHPGFDEYRFVSLVTSDFYDNATVYDEALIATTPSERDIITAWLEEAARSNDALVICVTGQGPYLTF